jgi:uncharacterized repeat protein (TIGR03803 family)
LRVSRSSIGLLATLAIFTAILFVTGTGAAAQEKVLHSFSSSTDGFEPFAGLIFDAAGNLYGTTSAGGASDLGTVFELTPSAGGTWTEKLLWSFGNGTDGREPEAGLIFDAAGNLYGTTDDGGTSNSGTVFELTPTAGGGWTEQVLHSFNYNGTDGNGPFAGLVFDAAGNLYGTTTRGGSDQSCTYGCGTVFELTPTAGGTWTEKVLHNFSNDGTDGNYPEAGLTFDTAGNLYGTTASGGSESCFGGCGTVFELTPAAGGTWTERVLHTFGGADGDEPRAGLVFDASGNLYGTTFQGGTYDLGTVFELTPAAGGTWTEKVLHSFGNGTDGANPTASLIFGASGNLYGTTEDGGTSTAGTVFELTPAAGGTWTEQVLHNFNDNRTDGWQPYAGLILDAAGNLYGTTYYGGTHNESGTVFEISPIPPTPLQFVPLSQPCRAVDTRPDHGGGGPIHAGTFQNFPISGEGHCATLPSAAVYSMNVTGVPAQHYLGYLTVWPAGQPQPLVSTLNSLDGRIKANAAIVAAGTSGAVSVYATDTTNVIVDVNGYFAPVTSSTLAFYPLTPCRVADTRSSSYPEGLGPPSLTGGQPRAFPILNATTTCNIPSSGVAAYSLNFSVVPHGSLFYMTVWPTGETMPVVATLNDIPGQIIANAAIVVAGTGGDVSVYPTNDTDLIIDINGYFAPAGTGGLSLYAATPCRVIDTRHVGSGQPFTGTLTPPVDVVHSPCEPPATAQAYVFNATVVPTGALGYLTLWPDGATKPLVSTLNALDGSITNNMAIVPSTNGRVDAFASGITQLILDISSYFAP